MFEYDYIILFWSQILLHMILGAILKNIYLRIVLIHVIDVDIEFFEIYLRFENN